MVKISKVQTITVDKNTGATVKEITIQNQTFYNRSLIYNQGIEDVETKILAHNGKKLGGVPIKAHYFCYSPKFTPRSGKIPLKMVTDSRTSKKEFYGCNVFANEIEYIKRKAHSKDKAVIMYPKTSLKDWERFDDQDIKTLILLQIKANIEYVSIPVSPRQNFDDFINILKWTATKINKGQLLNIILHPYMIFDELRKVVASISGAKMVPLISVVGLTPSQPANNRVYHFLGNNVSDNQLLIALDVSSKKEGLPPHLKFRLYNFDYTCDGMNFNYSPSMNKSITEKKTQNHKLYTDVVAAMLNEKSQLKYTERSVTEVLMNRFIDKVFSGVETHKLIKAFNFCALNDTGNKEVEYILNNQHIKYIEERLYLQAFVTENQEVFNWATML